MTSGTVQKLIAGPGVSLSPPSGRGVVTLSAGVGDSAFYDDTQGMAATNLVNTTVPLEWAAGLEQITGPDLSLNADNTEINILTTGVYACQLRSFIVVDASAGDMSGFFTSVMSASAPRGDLDLISSTNVTPFFLPQAAGIQTYLGLPSNWNLRLEAGSHVTFSIGAARLDGAGAITNTANGATELLLRRLA